MQQAQGEFVEQVIRPTGLVDPQVVVKPTKGQIDDLMHEIQLRTERDERVLVTTLTKKMAEDLTDYLLENGIRVRYLHSEVDTLRRVELLKELRKGDYDVLVGINLLREGLDLPEVSLVAILDADKEGFLRSGRSLIQTIGRAARNVSGEVHMYADKMTPSMRARDRRDRPAPGQADRAQRGQRHRSRSRCARRSTTSSTTSTARPRTPTPTVGGPMVGGGGRQMSRGKGPVPETRSRKARAVDGAGPRGHGPRRAGAADPGPQRPDAGRGARAAVRAGGPDPRRDRPS